MIVMKFRTWLFALSLLFSVPVVAEVTVDTDSLRLQFSQRGDLLRVEACFPDCSAQGSKVRLLSGGQGMLLFEQDNMPDLQFSRDFDTATATTSLSFKDISGTLVRSWLIPEKGWMVSVSSRGSEEISLMSGVDFRPRPSSGFGYLLEQSRYLFFDGTSVEAIGLDETERINRVSQDWFGFRNRFWTAMVRPGTSLSITPLTGESVEDASIEMTAT